MRETIRQSRRRLLALASATLALASGAAAAQNKTHTIEISGSAFVPNSIEIAKGDTVTWVNRDIVPHTATANDKSWDSGRLDRGKSWSLKPEAAGAIEYRCFYHASMTAKIVVK